MNTLTRAVELFGIIVDSKVCGGGEFYRSPAASSRTRRHLNHFSKYDKDDGKTSGADRVRFLLIVS
jgi:hypothetical protein